METEIYFLFFFTYFIKLLIGLFCNHSHDHASPKMCMWGFFVCGFFFSFERITNHFFPSQSYYTLCEKDGVGIGLI